jgi:GNAT superfamily N-acetyltransferase
MAGQNLIRQAGNSETQCLSELALRSKGHWGYSPEFLKACRKELSVDSRYLESHPVFVLDHNGKPAGFYSLEQISEQEVELGLLFVEPEYIGLGFGRQLIEHAKRQARQAGYRSMLIQGDPNATRFYLAAGGQPAGSSPSGSIPGRMLPLFRIELN